MCQLPADAPVFVGGQGNVRFDFGSRFRNHEAIFYRRWLKRIAPGHPCGFQEEKAESGPGLHRLPPFSEGFRPFSGPGTRRMPARKTQKSPAPEPTALQHRYSSSLQFIPFRFSFCMRERDPVMIVAAGKPLPRKTIYGLAEGSPASTGRPACCQIVHPSISTRVFAKPASRKNRARSWLSSQVSPSQ